MNRGRDAATDALALCNLAQHLERRPMMTSSVTDQAPTVMRSSSTRRYVPAKRRWITAAEKLNSFMFPSMLRHLRPQVSPR